MSLFKNPYLILTLVFVFIFFFVPCYDTDLGWHLRYGEYFINNLKFLTTNNLTYYLEGYYWPNSYSYYQVFIFVIYSALGISGLSILLSLLMSFSYLAFHFLNKKITIFSFFLYILPIAIGFGVFQLGLRAQIITYCFLIFNYYFLKQKKYFIVPFLFLFWPNLHGGFILGLYLLFIYLLNDSVINKAINKKLTAVFLLSFAFSLIGPYGINLYSEVIRHFYYPLNSIIGEWTSPKSATVILALVGLLWSSYIIKDYSKKTRIFWSFLIFPLFLLSLKSRRYVPIFFLFFSIITLENYPFIELLEKRINRFYFLILTLVVTILLGIRNTQLTYKSSFDQISYCHQSIYPYPCGAIKYLSNDGPNVKNIFTSYEWGGYLEWALPQYKYFVDGRMPTWKTEDNLSPYLKYLEIIQSKDGYNDKLNKYNTDMLLIGKGTFLDIELTDSDIWKLIYTDNLASIYVKR